MSTHTLNEINEPIFINYHKKTWKNTVYISWIIYFIFQLSLYLNSLSNNFCKYNHYDTKIFGNYYWYSNYGCLSAFLILWMVTFIKTIFMEKSKKRIPMLITLNVITISTLTSVLNIVWEKGSICIDKLDVATPTSVWAEWLVCGPQNVYIILTTTYFNDFNHIDYLLMLSFFLCILFGFFIIIPQPIELARFWLFLSCLFNFILYYLPFHKAKITYISEYAIINNDIREKIYKQQSIIRTKLSVWMTFILPFYTFTYLFGMFDIFNYSQTIIAFNILSVTTKGVFVALCSDIHLTLLNTAEELVITERKINIARRDFMKFIFHEIRNPLNTISIGLDLLKMLDFENDKLNIVDTLNMMRISSNNMTETLNGILNMHQIEEGKLELIYVDTDIRKILQNIQNNMKIYLLQKSIKLIIDIDDLSLPNNIKLDGGRIEQVINKLINNAIKYSPICGKVIVCVNISRYAPFDRRVFSFMKRNIVFNSDYNKSIKPTLSKPYSKILNISIADEGPGISEHNKTVIFNKFVQIRPLSLNNDDWGLNLAFCKKIIKLHGGDIWVESEIGKGSIFRFQIPIYENLYTKDIIQEGEGEIMNSNHVHIVQNDKLSDKVSEAKSENKKNNQINHHIFGSESLIIQPNIPTTQPIIEINTIPNETKPNDSSTTLKNINETPDSLPILQNSSIPIVPPQNTEIRKPSVNFASHPLSVGVTQNTPDAAVAVDPYSSFNLAPCDSHIPPNTSDIASEPVRISTSNNDSAIESRRESLLKEFKILRKQIVINNTISDERDKTSESKLSNRTSNSKILQKSTEESKISLHVLIVDDSETNCKMLAKLLKMNYITSDIAENGKIAVEMVSENINKYSMIFMDNLMPVMNGCIATTLIRDAGYNNIIAGVTGNILDEDINEFLDSGANIVYKKPISIISIRLLKEYVIKYGIIIEKDQKLVEKDKKLVKC